MHDFDIRLKNIKIADDSTLESTIPDVVKKVQIKEEKITETIDKKEQVGQQIEQEQNKETEIDNENSSISEVELIDTDLVTTKSRRISYMYIILIVVLILFILLVGKIFYHNRKSEN